MKLYQPKDTSVTTTPSFRGSCVRDGRHAYRSVDVAGELGKVVIEKFGWTVNLTQCDLEVVCILFNHYMMVGISLANPQKAQFRSRIINEDRSFMVDTKYMCTLRPSTAYLMLQLVEYQVGDILLDSMCGVGTIPIWCAEIAQNPIFTLGGELNIIPVEKAGQNATTRIRSTDICQWDATRLPLRNECVDKVLIDLPFGVRCGNRRQHSRVCISITDSITTVSF